MSKSFILKTFTTQMVEFCDDLIKVFPRDIDLKTGRRMLLNVKKINPKLIIISWRDISLPYKNQIDDVDIDFFLNKDYTEDLKKQGKDPNDNENIAFLNSIKEKVIQMNDSNKKKSFKYIQNLTKLTNMYFTETTN